MNPSLDVNVLKFLQLSRGLIIFTDQQVYMLQNRRSWNDFEDKAILTLVKKYGTKNWAEISEKMASKYGVETRTGKQCRERWHNHLNPDVKKDAWTLKEEKIMFEAHQKYGNRWTEIAKLFEGRTDNDIKNHFYSMLRRSLRRVNKLLGQRNSTKKVRLIKPSVLSKIFASNGDANSNESEDWRKISEALFEFSNSKSVDGVSSNLEEGEKHNLEDLIEKIAAYNQEYELSQLIKKESRRSSKIQEGKEVEGEVELKEPPIFKKMSSNLSIGSNKNLKTKKKGKGLKKQNSESSIKEENQADRKQTKRGRKKKENKVDQAEVNLPQVPQLQEKRSRLKKKDSQFSFHLGEEINIPDLFQLPQLQELSKKRSSWDSKKGSSSNRSNFSLSSNSPRMDLRIFARTPPGPSPNITDIFSRNLFNYQWKDNNQDLDNIVTQTRRAIERRTNRP